jgi:hypothetical protein
MSHPVALWLGLAGSLAFGSATESVSADRSTPVRLAGEVFIQQPKGMLPPIATHQGEAPKLSPESGVVAPANAGGAVTSKEAGKLKTAPEMGGAPIPGGNSTSQTSCNSSNASSPACYSATQQSRPPTR